MRVPLEGPFDIIKYNKRGPYLTLLNLNHLYTDGYEKMPRSGTPKSLEIKAKCLVAHVTAKP